MSHLKITKNRILDEENFRRGFLVDDELMAGIHEGEGKFSAFVLSQETGEYLSYRDFPNLELALNAIAQISRPWTYEGVGGCSNGGCGEGKSCSDGSCKLACSSSSNCKT